MFRVSILFMVTLLLFSATPIGFAQQNSVQAQAAADASADISDMSKVKWFLLGGIGSTIGCFLGCAAGCLLGETIFSNASRNSQMNCALAGSVLLGVCAVPIGVQMYPHNATPPPERLLGKSPEYVQAYTQVYKSRTVFLRKIFVTAGSIASNLGVMTTSVIIFLYGMGQHPVE